MVSFMSRPALSRIMSHQCPLNKRRGVRTHSLTRHHGNGETSPASDRNQTPLRAHCRGLVTTHTELSHIPHQRKNASIDFTQSLKSAPGTQHKQTKDTGCQRNIRASSSIKKNHRQVMYCERIACTITLPVARPLTPSCLTSEANIAACCCTSKTIVDWKLATFSWFECPPPFTRQVNITADVSTVSVETLI